MTKSLSCPPANACLQLLGCRQLRSNEDRAELSTVLCFLRTRAKHCTNPAPLLTRLSLCPAPHR